MNSGLRLWLPILLVSSVLALGLAPSAKADAIYSYTDPGNVSWSFEVPAILTTNTTISSFLSFTIVPGSFLSQNPCGTGDSVSLIPQQQGLTPPQIITMVGICSLNPGTFPTFTSLG